MNRRSDLSPPLGFPGGPCQVVERIQDVRNPRLREELIEDVEKGNKLDNAEASQVYDLETERGATGTRFKRLVLTPHAQYRMDQRGVTVNEVRLALQSFHKAWGDFKSRGDVRAKEWGDKLQSSSPLLWTDPKLHLAIAITAPGKGEDVRLVTTYWVGQSDPRATSCKVADAYLKEAWSPWVKDLVSPKSELNLPTDTDREKEVALPSGAATPNAPAGAGGGNRVIPKAEMNTPDNGVSDRPRTVGVPGDQYGVPYKEDYGYVTRRTMASAELILYNQEAPNKEIQYPEDGANYAPTSPTHWRTGPGSGDQTRPPAYAPPDAHLDDVPAGSSRVVPNGDGQMFDIGFRTAATLGDIASQTGPDVHQKALGVQVRLSRADPQKGIWTFTAMGSKGKGYTIKIKGLRKGNIKSLVKAQVQVSCDCQFFRWQGPEHWASTNQYLYGKPVGTASRPDVKDPGGKHWACKHIVAVLGQVGQYRLASTDTWLTSETEVFPEWASVSRVADRFQSRIVGQRVASLALKAAGEADLEQLQRGLKIVSFLLEEAKELPLGFAGKPGNYFKSPKYPQVGLYSTFVLLVQSGRAWGEYVIDHKTIPPKSAKALELAVRLLSVQRTPKDLVKWFEDNAKRFTVLVEAGRWPERSEEVGIRTIGSFRVHDTVGSSPRDWERAGRVLTRAERALSKVGLPGFSSMAYGDVYLVGQLGRKSWAAWFMPAKDSIYLRVNIRGVSEEDSARHLVHELAHRYWKNKLSSNLKAAWNSHHWVMSNNASSGRIPEVGEVLPVLVNNKTVRVKEYSGGAAVLVEDKNDKPVGTVPRMKLFSWMADAEHKGKFPSLYAATDAEEHFGESASLKAFGNLKGENLESFNTIFDI